MEYLRSTPSSAFWDDQSQFESNRYNFKELYNTVVNPNEYICIIGAGFSGLSTAYWLLQHRICDPSQIVLLDSDDICRGATGRNGGHCWPSPFTPSGIINSEELEQVKLANDWILESTNLFISFIQEHNINCSLFKMGAVNAYRFEEEIKEGKEYLSLLCETGMNFLENPTLLDGTHCTDYINTSYFIGGLFQQNAWQLWPKKVMYYIANMLIENGVKIRTKAHVYSVVSDEDRYRINFFNMINETESFKATHVVYATNAYTKELIPDMEGIITPVRGQIIATEPIELFTKVNLSINDGYEYLIQRLEDKRVLYGGMRWRSITHEKNTYDDSNCNPSISLGLQESLSELTSSNIKISHEWTGIMGYSCDKRALIGRLRKSGNLWIVAGYTGNGMPQCFGAGKVIADLISGSKKKWLEFFDPTRFEDASYRKRHEFSDLE